MATCLCRDCHMCTGEAMFAFVHTVLSVSGKSKSQCSAFLWPFSTERTNNSTVTQSLGDRTVFFITREEAPAQWGQRCCPHNKQKSDGSQQVSPAIQHSVHLWFKFWSFPASQDAHPVCSTCRRTGHAALANEQKAS